MPYRRPSADPDHDDGLHLDDDDDFAPPGPDPGAPGAWRRIVAARWSLTTAAGVAAVALLAAVAVVLVLRASITAPGRASSDPAMSSAGTAVTVPRAAALASASSAAATPSAAVTPLATSAGPAAATSSGELVVDVVGHVASPGLLHLPAGSRVDDAVAAAGGGRGADLDLINLARPLVDGEQLVVPAPGESVAPVAAPAAGAQGAGTAAGSAAATAVAPVSLRTATAAQLDTLPGIGPVLAQRIVDWRTTHGPFRSVDDVNQVSGIGDVLMGRLRPFLTL